MLHRKWAFCIFGQWFYPKFRQIFFIRETTLSSTILVAFWHVKWEKVSLLVDVRCSKTPLLKFCCGRKGDRIVKLGIVGNLVS